MFSSTAARLLVSLAFVWTSASAAMAQTPTALPTWASLCDDCFGTEYFGELLPGDTAGCQNYQHNLYENWTAEGTSSPDPKFVTASLADIVEVNQTSDTNFWYYQVVTRAANWNSVLLPRTNIEMAFGNCSDAATRYRLVLIYDVDPVDVGTTWRPQGNAKVKFFRDNSAGNNRIGDTNNDGPLQPGANTSNFDSNDDGYETSVTVAAADTYTRLATSSGRATVEFAVRRTAANLLAVANPFTPCFGRAWTVQSSSLSEAQFAVNDQRPTSDFTSTSWAIDSCNQPADAGACDPTPDCTAFNTPCATASCDPNGADGNCDTLTPVAAGTTCRASTGVCDPLEQCNGVATTCPADTLSGTATVCRPTAGVCDSAENCTGASGACPSDTLFSSSTTCRASGGVCDVAESCTGASATCPGDSFEPASTVCRGTGGVCDIAENCSGAAAACPADTFFGTTTTCRASEGVCDVAEVCSGAAAGCPSDTFLGTTTVCRADAGDCDTAEVCSGGAAACPTNVFEPADTACGSAADTICDNPDTCDGNGACQPNNAPGATLCRADAGECDVAESCDGAGSCPADAFEPEETACGSAADTICDNADSCDAGGVCQPNNEPGSTVCRADAGECDVAETCDGAGACPTDAFEPVDTACGSSDDTVCDNADSCDGGGVCQPNNEPGSTVCRADAGECDVAESCDGAGACPADAFEPEDIACGSSDDTVCDNADSCDAAGTCQPNNEPGSTVCRADSGACDVAESCDGAGACPADAFEPADTACGNPSETICDNADTCDGNGVCDPNNEPGSTVCRADAGDCDVAESCDGAGACPADAFEPEDTACGSSDDTVCDNADSCDAGGVCQPNNEPGSTLCRADAGDCDVAESCDGAGACPADAFEPEDTACGSSDDTVCDNADSCDAGGVCQPNHEPGSTVCRADAGDCDVAESCDGAGACPSDEFEPEDTACGSSDDTVCDNADSCDAGGVCLPNNEPGSTVCRADAGDCDVAESCDGAGACPTDAFEPEDTACGSSDDTVCDNADTCDGNGVCDPNNEPASTICRADAGDCDVAENCDGAGACPSDAFEPEDTACGSSDDTVCDDADTCDGSGTCQPNNEPGSTVCRDDAGECDVAESCDGAGACPDDAFEPADTACGSSDDTICDDADSCDGSGTCQPNNEPGSTVCRDSVDVCDVAETCDGAGACPSDSVATTASECREPAGPCDAPENCNGVDTACPADLVSTEGTVCRSEAGGCDIAETCDGLTVDCPGDVVEVAETICRPVADVCDTQEVCDGSDAACPTDAFQPSSLECRGSADVCDVSESCTGTAAACPGDGFATSNMVCRSSVAQCDATELCTGAGITCPADVDLANGAPCNDSNACTDSDSCDDGDCTPGDPVVCDDGDLCTVDSCDTQTGCETAPDLRVPETCYNSEAGRLVVTDRTIVRKDSIRWTWRRGETMEADALGDPGGATSYSVCVFDMFAGEPRLATSIAVPAGPLPFWKKVTPTRFRYIDSQGTNDGLRRFVARMNSKPNRSKLVVRARGLGVPLPTPVDASQLFDVDPSVIVQVLSSDDVCWSTEFTIDDTLKNVPLKYRGRFH